MPRWLSELLLSHHIPCTRKEEEQEHSGPLTPLQAKSAPFSQPSPKDKTFLLASLWPGLSPVATPKCMGCWEIAPFSQMHCDIEKKMCVFLLRREETLNTRWQLAASAFHPWKEMLILTMNISSNSTPALLIFWANQFFVMVNCSI